MGIVKKEDIERQNEIREAISEAFEMNYEDEMIINLLQNRLGMDEEEATTYYGIVKAEYAIADNDL